MAARRSRGGIQKESSTLYARYVTQLTNKYMNKDKQCNIIDLKASLIEELEDRKEEILEAEHTEDVVYEIVESYIPIYHAELLELAMSDLWFATAQPDMEYETPIDGIRWNVYETLTQEVAHEWMANNEDTNQTIESIN